MRRCWPVVFLALLIGLGSVATLAGSASSAPAGCTVQLRVNVFGPTSPQSNWSLHGGLDAGKLATLRAVARGCDVDHITGLWRDGASGAFPGSAHPCSGSPCFWGVRSNFMSAADFQAFATPAGGRVRSNIVRVGWAGSAVVGTWRWFWAAPGEALAEHGTITFSSDHTMTWTGGDNGTWSQTQDAVELTWPNKQPRTTHDIMTLSQDGRTMDGQNDLSPPWQVRGVKQ